MTPLFSNRHFHCALILSLVGAALGGCNRATPVAEPNLTPATPASTSTSSASTSRAAASTQRSAIFEEVAAQSGVRFVHQLGNRGRYWFPENTPPGCAFLDFDNDGWQDIFLFQSGSPIAAAGRNPKRAHCALYRNNRDGTFRDVTRGSGFDRDLGYAQGVAVGDFDNDGRSDVFLSSYAGNFLFRNRGNGRFEDVTRTQNLHRVHDTGYATSAAWGDFDNDGRLDLYVCYYTRWTPALEKECRDSNGVADYCSPLVYETQTHRLYRNSGRGFTDVSESSGIAKERGRGLAVAFFDYNGDGRQDIFVANDLTPNMLWQNLGKGRFRDVALETGCAFGDLNKAMAGMGVAVADYNRSGRPSLYVTNFSGRANALFKNNGNFFQESSASANLVSSKLNLLSFGCEFFDYDADGWDDLIVNNGHVQSQAVRREPGVPHAQRKQLLRNNGDGTFTDILDSALETPRVGRGLAVGDYDNDGALDILATNQNAAVQLFRNGNKTQNHWISFQTRGVKSNRDGLHTRFEIRVGKTRQTGWVRAGSSYLSSSDKRVYFGLKDATKIDEVKISWPSGTKETLQNLKADTFYRATEGSGVTMIPAAK